MSLEIENLETHFYAKRGEIKAVDNVSLFVKSGESVGLVGESGCGKSTLAASIMRLVSYPSGKIVGGRVKFEGRDLLQATPREMQHVRGKEISMIFQDPMTYLNPVMTIGDQIGECIRLHQSRTNVKQKVIELLTKVRMVDPLRAADSYPHQLSGGMKQRALISIAIACTPKLLIADEPTTALDVTVQAQILDLIQDIKEELQTSLLLITHDLGIVSEMCERVYIMYAGRIVEQASVFDMFNDPKHPYTQGLLNAVLSITEFKNNLEGIPGSVPDLVSPPSGCRFHPRCKEAIGKCSVEPPPGFPLGNDRTVFCWLYEKHISENSQ